jgi:PAS domain S-box-containing protein
MSFVIEKDPNLIPQVLSTILDSTNNGITLADPDLEDMPIVYANKAFETMTGYAQDEIIGRNCRFLQGKDRGQDARLQLRKAIEKCLSVEVDIRNYKKNGEMFYNHLVLTPLFDEKNQLLYYLGVQHDITKQVEAAQEIARLKQRLAELEASPRD